MRYDLENTYKTFYTKPMAYMNTYPTYNHNHLEHLS